MDIPAFVLLIILRHAASPGHLRRCAKQAYDTRTSAGTAIMALGTAWCLETF